MFIILFMIMAVNAKVKRGWITPSGFLIGLYVLSAMLSIPTLNIDGYTEPQNPKYLGPMLLFLFSMLCFLMPVIRFNETKATSINLPSKLILDIFSTTIIILSFFSILFFSRIVVNIFLGGDLGTARNALYAGEQYVEEGLMNTIASVSASLYVFAIVLFFIYQIIGNSRKRCMLLLVSSLSEPLHVLSYVGRDGVVFWFFTFFFMFLFFRRFLPEKSVVKLKKTFFRVAMILILPFLAISISRFLISDSGVGGSIISYLGHGFINGTLFFGIEDPPLSYGTSFPLFREIFGLPEYQSSGLTQIGEWKSWKFNTFIVKFYINFGFAGMFFVAMVSAVFFKAVMLSAKNRINFSQLIIYILYFQIYSQGLFYFRHYTRGGNLFILISIVMGLTFYVLERTPNRLKLSLEC